MKAWFDGTGEIACALSQIIQAHRNLGEFYVAVVGHMPGLSKVDLVDMGEDFVVIRTNEGLMTRSNITTSAADESFVVEFDEVYEAGSTITTRSHYRDAYTTHESGVINHVVISGVNAPGLLGFLYRNFGNKSIGNAVLAANKSHLEEQDS